MTKTPLMLEVDRLTAENATLRRDVAIRDRALENALIEECPIEFKVCGMGREYCSKCLKARIDEILTRAEMEVENGQE